MSFGEGYSKYWELAINKSVDGSIIPGLEAADFFLSQMDLKRDGKLLDLGCSFGRMFPILSKYSNEIFGVDLDPYALKKASSNSYKLLKVGTAEETCFENNFFSTIFCWAVFDVVNQAVGIAEMSRILSDGGMLLVTGKNDLYDAEDVLAFNAEKNAFLKNFPNKFTNLPRLKNALDVCGLSLEKLFIFPRRGDFGALRFIEESTLKDSYVGYEYLAICRKIKSMNDEQECILPCHEKFSETAMLLAVKAGYMSVEEYFNSLGIS